MKLEFDIPDYTPERGITLEWEEGFAIKVEVTESGTVHLMANQAALVSLARHLLALSSSPVPVGSHLHLDEHNSLEEGSRELILEKML